MYVLSAVQRPYPFIPYFSLSAFALDFPTVGRKWIFIFDDDDKMVIASYIHVRMFTVHVLYLYIISLGVTYTIYTWTHFRIHKYTNGIVAIINVESSQQKSTYYYIAYVFVDNKLTFHHVLSWTHGWACEKCWMGRGVIPLTFGSVATAKTMDTHNTPNDMQWQIVVVINDGIAANHSCWHQQQQQRRAREKKKWWLSSVYVYLGCPY